MNAFLQPGTYIDSDHDLVRSRAAGLSRGLKDDVAIARACFEFVRDAIRHSWDHRCNPVTVRASEALRYGTGYCYAKSHLLAALLRANGIPAGLCYQRLSVNDAGPPYCLHGLNAVHLVDHGWYRCDARGNKVGIAAGFDPPREHLAYPIRDPGERDLPQIHAEPLPEVIRVLEGCCDVDAVHAYLPDVRPWA